MNLYPLIFETIFKEKIWGGKKIKSFLNKDFAPLKNCGETWEISGVNENVSIVKEGILKGKSLNNLISEYKEALLGKHVYEKFGNEFPLLIKFIDANDDLSIQVHPDDTLAKLRHNGFGKTEMWYILQADKGAKLNIGFNTSLNQETYLKHLESNTLHEILNYETVNVGDVFYLPSGRVHYIGKGVCLAEIQQTSDITYRIYDFDRVDDEGNKRELHTEQALAAIDFNHYTDYKTQYEVKKNDTKSVVRSPYFTTNIIYIDSKIDKNYKTLDSFVILICVEGKMNIEYQSGSIQIKNGETVLLPACINNVSFTPKSETKILEVYVP